MYPVVFVGHGAATFSMSEENLARKAWKEESIRIQSEHGRPRGIVCVSAHFVTRKQEISCGTPLQTVHDHPAEELYSFKYPAKTGPSLTAEIEKLFLKVNGASVTVNLSHGLDHGAWIPLSAFFPDADVPVVLVSLLESLDFKEHFKLGELLGSMREHGYLILASGSSTHNLGTFRKGYFSGQDLNSADTPNLKFQEELDKVLGECGLHNNIEKMFALTSSQLFREVHPTPEHFVPLVVAVGAAFESAPHKFHQSFQYGLSMASYVFKR